MSSVASSLKNLVSKGALKDSEGQRKVSEGKRAAS